MIVNKCSEILLAKSKKLYGNYRDNCTVVQRMLEKYKKLYPNISKVVVIVVVAVDLGLTLKTAKYKGL